MRYPRRLSLAALSLSIAACSIFVGGPELPAPPVVGSPDALRALQSDVEAAMLNSVIDGRLRLSITQEQLTALVASRLSTDGSSVLADPQVILSDQEMLIYGRARYWVFEANAALSARFTIDESGVPALEIVQAQLGPVPMPRALQDTIELALDEALTGYVGPAAIGFRLEAIEISSGTMTIMGRLR